MKKLLVALFSLALLGATPAYAETTIAVVNIQKIMQASKAANSVRAQLQAKQKSFQAELDAKEKQLLAEDQVLVKQKGSSEDAAFNEKVKAFRTKAATAQREVQTKKAQLDKAFGGALEQIQTNVLGIVKEVAAEKKINLVLTSSQVLYADTALDITAEVLKRLDSKSPNVSVNF